MSEVEVTSRFSENQLKKKKELQLQDFSLFL